MTACTFLCRPEEHAHPSQQHLRYIQEQQSHQQEGRHDPTRLPAREHRKEKHHVVATADPDQHHAAIRYLTPLKEKLKKPALMMMSIILANVSKAIHMEKTSIDKQLQAAAMQPKLALNCEQQQPNAVCAQNSQRTLITFFENAVNQRICTF
jgi:hypothetical protein